MKTSVLTCLDNEDHNHKEGEANQEWQRNTSQVEAVLAPKHKRTHGQEQNRCGYES